MTDYHLGFVRNHLNIHGRPGYLVEPAVPLPGRPWVWKAEFFDCYTELDAALLGAGYHIAYLRVGNTFGAPAALAHWDRFYDELVERGLSHRPALIAYSRGGLYAYRWAATHVGQVSCIYADNPVCDFRSWPGGMYAGPGSAEDWSLLLHCYGFNDEAAAMVFAGQPIDLLQPLVDARVPLLHRVGDEDEIVPVAENTFVLAERYRACGGSMEVITSPGGKHHPHGLPDPSPIVTFIRQHSECRDGSRN
jgi:pimeloyl-ACP methyl ester carboxylesterase